MWSDSMRRVLILTTLVLASCAAPTTPTAATSVAPLHHNIPATFAGHPEGPVIYLCETQPRTYEGHVERDHYLQYEPCPTVPID